MSTIIKAARTVITLATAYADQSEHDEITFPEDLAALSADELSELQARASEAFDSIYGDGSTDFDAETVAALAGLTEGIEALAVEESRREEASIELRTQAEALAARARPVVEEVSEDDEVVLADDSETTDTEDEGAEDADPVAETEEVEELEVVAASAGPKRVNLSSVRRNTPRPAPKAPVEKTMRSVAYSTTDSLGFGMNEGIDFADAGRMLSKRLTGFPEGHYAAAQSRGQHMREQHSLMAFKRDIPKEAIVASSSPDEVDRALSFAVDQSRLPGGELTAAGWCAPSENLYDLCMNESRDGLFSLPEVGVTRGGINVPVSPSFADIYGNIGFSFTEAQAIAGEFKPNDTPGEPNVVGDKPCYEIACPDWEDTRLRGDGLCITGDILQQRSFPEMLARITQGALIAHDHKVSANQIAAVVAGSTAITMTTAQVGATAPLLTSIELQVEHYRYTQRLSRSTLLEGVFPYWVRGAIRADLSRRLGTSLMDVTDAQIDGWFRIRGLVPQYVYDWQNLDTTAANAFKAFPSTVDFLLYQAGTWVRGVEDIITLDTLYDSALLGQNKFTALFTEEAWLVAQRCVDSRAITVALCPDGATHAGVLIECDGSETPPA